MQYQHSQFRGLIETSFKTAVEIYQGSDDYRSSNPEPVIQASILEADGYTWLICGFLPEGNTRRLATVDTLRGYALKGFQSRRTVPYNEGVPV